MKVHIVMRSEEHADYIEVVFAKREDAEEYLKRFVENDSLNIGLSENYLFPTKEEL